ncbi:YozE family protein [Ligilactobacillus salivarius]|uniref:YozE family protein n=1 Tax=Ligilactobacillus salivarius TaxID=1624 RepID=UPI000E4526B0|nr:YozE family protein [Ligilactobacillus salivarius]RGM26748.1 YozE family protein [Ligilactobacillus salivarius]
MSKRQSFYQFLMTERNPDSTDEIAQFANNAIYDQSFPKQADDYDSLSQYLELNGTYLPSMVIFDNAWTKYEEFMS